MTNLCNLCLVLLTLHTGTTLVLADTCKSSNQCTATHNEKWCSAGCALYCNDARLTDVPNLPKDTECLDMTYNKLKRLRSSAFVGLDRLKLVDFSFNDISSVANGTFQAVSETLTSIDFYYNGLTTVNRTMFQRLNRLTQLKLNNNNIFTIENGSFDDLRNLTVLLLNNNDLFFSDYLAVPVGLFDPLVKLAELNIHNNNYTNMATYRGDIVRNMQNLQNFTLDGVADGVPFPVEFSTMFKLSRINIYGGMDYINNETLRTFSSLPLERFSVLSTRLQRLESMAFQHLRKIKELSLAGNRYLSFCNVQKAWPGLQHRTLENLGLQNVMNDFTNYALLPCNFFNGFNTSLTKLKGLYLGSNNLVTINKEISHHLRYLETLSFSNNRIQEVKELRCVIPGSSLELHPNPTYCYKYCANVTDNLVSSISGSKYGGSGLLFIPQSLQHLDLSAAISYDLQPFPSFTISNCSNIKNLYLDYCQIVHFKGPIRFQHLRPNHNISVSLRGNRALEMSPNFIIDVPLVKMDLGENRLGEHFYKDTEGDILQSYKTLQYLDLSENNIKNLPFKFFSGLFNLVQLNLSQNALVHIDFSIAYCQKMSYLDLSYNLISYLDFNNRTLLDDHQKTLTQGLQIDFSNNPLVCSCATTDFLNWIYYSDTTTKVNFRRYQCFFDGEVVTLGHFQDSGLFLEMLHKCNSKTYLIVALTGLFVTVISFVTLILCYRFRWELKFCFVRRCHNREYKELLKRNEDENRHSFHAFVAYHEDDLNWVRTQLLANLEDGSSADQSSQTFNLFVHDRDFLPGRAIEENIMEGINASRKTIVVLSRSFLQSGWCQFEVQMARIRSFDKKENTIIVIVLESIPTSELTPTMAALLRQTTILEWPEFARERPEFWRKLTDALKCADLTPLVCECGRSVRLRWQTRPHDERTEDGHLASTNELDALI